MHPHCLTANNHTAPKRGPLCGPQNATKGGATVATFCDSQNGPWPASSPMAGYPWQASGRGSDASVVEIIASISSPQRCGRHEAAPLSWPLLLSMAKAHRFSQTNCGGGATPCALFCSPIQRSKRASSTNLCASVRTVRGMSSLQSSHWASVSTGVSRKRVSISCVQVATSSSMTRAYFRSVASAMVGPAVG